MKQKAPADSVASRAKKMMNADRRLFRKYRGQHVAYIDCWKKSKEGVRLVRKIVGHGAPTDINEAWQRVAGKLRARVVLRYISDLPPDTLESLSFQVGPA
jgi:hypothetical protein